MSSMLLATVQRPLSTLTSTNFSPLVLADRLLSLAQEADRAGYSDSASRLIGLLYAVLDDAGAETLALPC